MECCVEATLRVDLWSEIVEGYIMVDFKVAQLTFNLRCLSAIRLMPLKEASFRGALGSTFHGIVCSSPQHEKCNQCMLF
jgi:hypothetical protein